MIRKMMRAAAAVVAGLVITSGVALAYYQVPHNHGTHYHYLYTSCDLNNSDGRYYETGWYQAYTHYYQHHYSSRGAFLGEYFDYEVDEGMRDAFQTYTRCAGPAPGV